jgi:3-oxosteroid 1-dehydrogenase
MTGERQVDMVIVGWGVGGLTAALAARSEGLEVLVLEKSEHVGGTSAWSGGVIWAPDNHLMRAAGVRDSVEDGLRYLEAVVGDGGPATSTARKQAYVRAIPEVLRFLERLGMAWVYADGAIDYYPEAPGGMGARGRSVNARMFDTRRLGDWEPRLRPQKEGAVFPVVLAHYAEAPPMATMLRSLRGARVAAKVTARTVWALATRKRLVSLGQSLMARMLLLTKQQNLEIWRNTPTTDLVVSDGRVVGVLAERNGRPVRIVGRHGVLLTAGGYARNTPMRKEFRDPASGDWSLVIPEDTGDMITAAQRHGAATDLMDEAIWTPVSMTPEGAPVAHLWERWLPHAIIVDGGGARYVNESTSYMAVGQAMYQRNEVAPAIPSWLVIDSRHRRRYPFGSALPGITPKSWITSGYLKKADTIEDLARQCGIPVNGLRDTVERFNRMADAGRDDDFGRGSSKFDLYFHDPRVKPCPVLGSIARPPFYAVAVYPGDVSTYGGLVTDEHARVLRSGGSVIEGLYAAGSTAASVCGHRYPGAGIAVGGAAAFSYLGARHIVERSRAG